MISGKVSKEIDSDIVNIANVSAPVPDSDLRNNKSLVATKLWKPRKCVVISPQNNELTFCERQLQGDDLQHRSVDDLK
jgi:hypothetical protein